MKNVQRSTNTPVKTEYTTMSQEIYAKMDSQKQLKLCRFPQRTCKLMRLKVVI